MATKKPKQVVRLKDEEFTPYGLRVLNQLRQQLDEEVKNEPVARRLIKKAFMDRIANWCIGLLLVFTTTQVVAQDTLQQEPYGVAMEMVAQAQDEQPDTGESSGFPWDKLGIALVAVFELVVRLKPTGKDWSILSRIAGIIEWLIPNRASAAAVHRQKLNESIKPPEGKEQVEQGKWIGGKVWHRIKNAWSTKDPDDAYPQQD